MSDLSQMIRNIASHQLAPAQIVDVRVEEDVDHDGDPILRITIIYDAAEENLDARRALGMARHLREPFEKRNIERFPVLRYLSKEDAAGEAA